ncbi:hypothetical protein H0H87_001444 [Tephrocybe sp. NHM501043]|nr:hypothetical protein H0H87_001444 [Tephrocybe sp. NHM501043]
MRVVGQEEAMKRLKETLAACAALKPIDYEAEGAVVLEVDTSWMAEVGSWNDAKYLKGMLSNPGVGPNATIMRWIEDILIFYFTLHHVPEKTFSVDGLSRRTKQEGDEQFPPVEEEMLDGPEVLEFGYPDKSDNVEEWEDHVPLLLEDFADQIDLRGGYMLEVASSEEALQE